MNYTKASRRGSVYVLVLACSLFVVGAGVAASLLARRQLASQAHDQQTRQCAWLADAGLELSWQIIEDWNDAWGRVPEATWFSVLTVGDTVVQVRADDPADADMTNGGPIKLTARAINGDIMQMRSMILDGTALDANELLERPGSRRREVLP